MEKYDTAEIALILLGYRINEEIYRDLEKNMAYKGKLNHREREGAIKLCSSHSKFVFGYLLKRYTESNKKTLAFTIKGLEEKVQEFTPKIKDFCKENNLPLSREPEVFLWKDVD